MLFAGVNSAARGDKAQLIIGSAIGKFTFGWARVRFPQGMNEGARADRVLLTGCVCHIVVVGVVPSALACT